jgi:CubicO group peptidase (beta-lactamase class C family)
LSTVTVLLLVLAMPLSAGTLKEQKGGSSTQPDAIDEYIHTKMRKKGIPGVQLAIVHKGEKVTVRSYGKAVVEKNIPVDRQTVFSIASITKAFIGVSVMQLVEEGKLDLDAPTGQYLDDLPPDWRPIRVRQLLTHVSGLPDVWGNYNVIAKDEQQALRMAEAMPMRAAVGQRFEYNQTNYLLISHIITKLSGMPFTEFVAKKQLDVVGMPHTGFRSVRALASVTDAYAYFLVTPSGTTPTTSIQNRTDEEVFPDWLGACNGLNSNAEDLARWVIALKEHKLLKAESLTALWTPGRLGDGTLSGGFGGFLNGYALGWETVTRRVHPAVVATGGERAALFIYPDEQLSIVVLTNLAGSEPEGWVDDIAALYRSAHH